MLIKKLILNNFRNWAKGDFSFGPGVTVIVGPNTAGKSNLLEAIFLLAFGSSPRAELDREMVQQGEKLAMVGARVEGSEEKDLEVALTETGKRLRVNGVRRRLLDFRRHFHAVLFSPEDLNLVTGTPDRRRRFLDFALGSVDQIYAYHLLEYDKVRKRRNRLLEQVHKSFASEEELEFWDAKLLEHGVFLQNKRREFFDEINPPLERTSFFLLYNPSGLTAERLLEVRLREIIAETSLIGPHRDDFGFKSGVRNHGLGEMRDLAAYGSRGEQRRAVLTLKSAELDYVERRIGSRPVLLLDDIFSELDEENRARIFNLIGKGQTIITTTDLGHVPASLQKDLPVINL